MDAASGVSGILWWIGLVAVFTIVIPLVLFLAQRLLGVIAEIRRYAEDILEHGLAITGNLDPVPELIETRDRMKRVGSGFDRYVQAVDRMLRSKR